MDQYGNAFWAPYTLVKWECSGPWWINPPASPCRKHRLQLHAIPISSTDSSPDPGPATKASAWTLCQKLPKMATQSAGGWIELAAGDPYPFYFPSAVLNFHPRINHSHSPLLQDNRGFPRQCQSQWLSEVAAAIAAVSPLSKASLFCLLTSNP